MTASDDKSSQADVMGGPDAQPEDEMGGPDAQPEDIMGSSEGK